jgi:hypothetical protein
VHQSKCSYYVFHAFSNGGCGVWEHVRRILDLPVQVQPSAIINDQSETETLHAISSLRERTAGVVFDSCPSKLAKIGWALKYCTVQERLPLLPKFGLDVAFLPELISKSKQEKLILRGNAYVQGLQEDPFDIPQLYLYSESDELIPYQVLDDLVDRRRELIGTDRIYRKKWRTSRHCAHLLDHPEDYATTIESFLERCQIQDPKSRL